MQPSEPFAYAVLQVVPRADRGERVNVGVVLFCRRRDFLAMRWHLAADRLLALDKAADLDALREQLQGLERTAQGDPAAGPVAELPISERFHWLVAPSSTMIVAGEVHTGLASDPAAELDHLYGQLVL
jgi:hypothetical protein